jgi:hypothetical protein
MTRSVGGFTRYAHLWLPGFLKSQVERWGKQPPKRVWLTLADHFEPYWRRPEKTVARDRVRAWRRRLPGIARLHCDSAGQPPKYTFFYAEEEYTPEFLDTLAEMVELGIADVEVHLHHDGEGEQNFVDRMSKFIETLRVRHGLLRVWNGKPAFGFIHGNWALDNSGPGGRNCGLNNELLLLKRLGCYADFTFPAAAHPSQPRLVNTIYWAIDDPARPKSHDSGIPHSRNSKHHGDLLIVPGPLALNWRGGRFLPRIETGELAAGNDVTVERVRLWLQSAPRIDGDVFIKLFAHGAREDNAGALLDRDLRFVFRELEIQALLGGFDLRYVSAWEMRQAIDAAVGQASVIVEDSKCQA